MIGRIKDIGIAYPSRNASLSIEIDISPEQLVKYQDKELEITIKEYRKKRSLNANSYFWVLVTELAKKERTSTTEVHNKLVQDYGQLERLENGDMLTTALKDDIDVLKLQGIVLKYLGKDTVNSLGTTFHVYAMMRGSHTYNTEEMAHLIDGTISEAEEAGIDVITPDEKKRMMALWRPNDKTKF